MKDQRKKAVEDVDEIHVLEQRPDVSGDDDTQQVPTLTVEEVERFLKDEKPGS